MSYVTSNIVLLFSVLFVAHCFKLNQTVVSNLQATSGGASAQTITKQVQNLATGCQIDIKQLNERHPLFLDVQTKTIRYPDLDAGSVIKLSPGEKLELDCPGGANIQTGSLVTDTLTELSCVSGTQVQFLGATVNVSEIVCSKRITSVARYTGYLCAGAYRELEVGFEIRDGRFIHQMSGCFDDIRRFVIWTTFVMSRQIGSATTGNSQPSWTEGDFYNIGARLNNIYTKVAARATINSQLGLAEDDEKYVKSTGNYYYAKGHLTARTDFLYNAQQQATYHYINSSPQWQTFNALNWFYFEDNLRNYAAANFVDLIVYTGTYGISTLPHEQTGLNIDLYFYVDENGNKAMPVPELFWKIAYEPISKAGVVVLGINNPYQTDVQKSIICNDIADDLNWLTFDRIKIESGYIYACTVDDLRKVIPYLPELDVVNVLN